MTDAKGFRPVFVFLEPKRKEVNLAPKLAESEKQKGHFYMFISPMPKCVLNFKYDFHLLLFVCLLGGLV